MVELVVTCIEATTQVMHVTLSFSLLLSPGHRIFWLNTLKGTMEVPTVDVLRLIYPKKY